MSAMETLTDPLIVRVEKRYRSLLAGQAFQKGEVICQLPSTKDHSKPTQHTIQVSQHRHIEVGAIASMNHSCNPNVIIDTVRMLVIAARDIPAGGELTFFYPSTEWEMTTPFICLCGSPNCIHVVAGARFLPLSTLGNHYINPHIREMLMELLAHTDNLLPTLTVRA